MGAQSTNIPGRQFALIATVVGGCRLESSDLNTALSRIGLLAQAKEELATCLGHCLHSPVIGVGQELALELPRTTAKIQVCIFFSG